MKYLSCLFLFFSSLVFSQNPVSQGKIEYDMILALDEIVENNTQVLFNQNCSIFQIKSKKADKSYSEEVLEEGKIEIIETIETNPKFIFIDKSRNKIFANEILLDNRKEVIVEENIEKMEWSLGNETKKIGNYNASNAFAVFKGRNYTAWYTMDLPYDIGPWKFKGLPGVILEVKDAEEEVMFYAKKISIPFNEPIKYVEDNDTKVISKKEFQKRQDEYSSSYEQRLKSKISKNRNVSIKVKSIKINTIEK